MNLSIRDYGAKMESGNSQKQGTVNSDQGVAWGIYTYYKLQINSCDR